MHEHESKQTRGSAIVSRFRALLDDLYIGEKTYSRVSGWLITMVRASIATTRKFIEDDCSTMASSIAYTAIVSLIPTLTVALTFYSLLAGMGAKKEELFRQIMVFMTEHNIKLNIDPMIEAITALIDNAGKIGGIGAVILIFSATAVLRTLEKSLNTIWGVQQNRPVMLRVIYYWAALTLGPIMLITGTTVATQVSNALSSPNFHAAAITETGAIWTAGNKARILSSKGDLAFTRIDRRSVDFENSRVMEYDTASRNFNQQEYRIEEFDFDRGSFRDVQFMGSRGWIVGAKGMLLTTEDGGRHWALARWGSYNFNAIHMLTPMRGFIAADNGFLLSTTDGGNSWAVRDWVDITANLFAIDFRGQRGIVVGERGTFIATTDGGATWDAGKLNESRVMRRHVNLNHVRFANGSAWIVGDEGLILRSTDGGTTWKSRKHLDINYFTAYFIDARRGYVAGEKGALLSTDSGGERWTRHSLATPRVNRIQLANGTLWAFGHNGFIQRSTDGGQRWSGLRGSGFFIGILNFLAPFVIIWLMFFLVYLVLPHAKVPARAALIGSSFTGAVWVAFTLLFIVYVKYFSYGTHAIYGALASIPLFLLMIYSSAVIFLYGAQVCYTAMHPHTYLKLKKKSAAERSVSVYNGISLLHAVYRRFESGGGAMSLRELQKATGQGPEELERYLRIFSKARLLRYDADTEIAPLNASSNVTIASVIGLLHDAGLTPPASAAGPAHLRKYLSEVLADIAKSRAKIVGNTTLKDLIAKAP